MKMVVKDSKIQFVRPNFPLADVGISLKIVGNLSTPSQKVSPALAYFWRFTVIVLPYQWLNIRW